MIVISSITGQAGCYRLSKYNSTILIIIQYNWTTLILNNIFESQVSLGAIVQYNKIYNVIKYN